MAKPLPALSIKKGPFKEKVRCPHCNGIDTRRYPARGYAYCFVCEKEIPLPKDG